MTSTMDLTAPFSPDIGHALVNTFGAIQIGTVASMGYVSMLDLNQILIFNIPS
jgi:hypothetical protein